MLRPIWLSGRPRDALNPFIGGKNARGGANAPEVSGEEEGRGEGLEEVFSSQKGKHWAVDANVKHFKPGDGSCHGKVWTIMLARTLWNYASAHGFR
jgi:hypothetical protein